MNYFNKMKGHTQSPPRVGMVEILWSWVIGAAGVGTCRLKGIFNTAHALKGQHRITEIFAKPFAHFGPPNSIRCSLQTIA